MQRILNPRLGSSNPARPARHSGVKGAASHRARKTANGGHSAFAGSLRVPSWRLPMANSPKVSAPLKNIPVSGGRILVGLHCVGERFKTAPFQRLEQVLIAEAENHLFDAKPKEIQ